jgi:hypothetical protein
MALQPGNDLNSVPASNKQALSTNYIDFTASATKGWAQQYVPDLMEKEAEVFGPRTISGFLEQVGAEEAMTSDQVIWSEQGRLHLSYKGKVHGTGNQQLSTQAGGEIEIESDIDDNATLSDGSSTFTANHGIRVNDTLLVADANTTVKCIVTHVDAGGILSVAVYGNSTGLTAALGSANTGSKSLTILVYGSEFHKGGAYNASTVASSALSWANSDSRGANEPDFKTFTNQPIIMKDYYEVSGSDASRIGWIEVSSEGGASGYLWYVKAEADTRARFNDYIEMAMLESEKAVAATDGAGSNVTDMKGTEGLFSAITDRGNVTTGISGVNAATDLSEFDAILAEFDKQGAIEEYMLFCNRASSLAIDDMLASMNSYGAGGTSYGVFDNDEDMALNLGFSGFRRGSYDFYKSDFRYLNDLATRGGINAKNTVGAIRGVLIPAGTSSVYDQQVGASMRRPFLHVRYRASQTDDRRMKTWVTGSVGAATSALDAMQLHMLTERCLVVQGANNFMLMQ